MKRKIIKYLLRIACRIVFKKHNPFIVAITGNAGKTTTKEAVFSILKENFGEVRSTKENLNTDIGVPLGILGLNNAKNNLWEWTKNGFKLLFLLFGNKNFPKYLVLELAADKPKEIEYFMKFIPVDIGIITTIGEDPVHLEFFPNKNRLIEEKSWLARGIKREGVVILNNDDAEVFKMKDVVPTNAKLLLYGSRMGIDKSAEGSTIVSFSGPKIGIDEKGHCPFSEISFFYNKTIAQGRFNNIVGNGYAYAFAASIACGISLGIPISKSVRILERKFLPLAGRLNVINNNKVRIIDDSYNASPISYYNALDVMACLGSACVSAREILILGDMAELGSKSDQIHKGVLERALKVADIIILVGEAMEKASKNKRVNRDKILYIKKNSSDALVVIKKIVKSNDIILIKGSHAMEMNLIVEGLRNYDILG
jgi:UDP-N-acetylmuramoyl-tripeptide--D-alanyl-D-alanine ligase